MFVSHGQAQTQGVVEELRCLGLLNALEKEQEVPDDLVQLFGEPCIKLAEGLKAYISKVEILHFCKRKQQENTCPAFPFECKSSDHQIDFMGNATCDIPVEMLFLMHTSMLCLLSQMSLLRLEHWELVCLFHFLWHVELKPLRHKHMAD